MPQANDAHTISQSPRYNARIGSISTGTLRTVDLIDTFAGELEYLIGETPLTKEAYAYLEADLDTLDTPEIDAEQGDQILEELTDALQELAPPYCYFGAHEGDGADFGFWPIWDQIEELPRVEDSDQAKTLGEDACFVNDHGNVTVYGGDGSIILAIV